MKILNPGHYYLLNSAEGVGPRQPLQFIEKARDDDGEFVLRHDGTTNEEVLRVLINRIEYLNKKLPCRENENALRHLRNALEELKYRTKARQTLGVEGTDQPH